MASDYHLAGLPLISLLCILQMSKQLDMFKTNLEEFASKHKQEIRKNPEFRVQFQDMCATIGVDPLACKELSLGVQCSPWVPKGQKLTSLSSLLLGYPLEGPTGRSRGCSLSGVPSRMAVQFDGKDGEAALQAEESVYMIFP